MKRLLVLALVLMMLALAVSSVSADVVIRPPPIPCSVLPMESISLNNIIIRSATIPDAASSDEVTVEGGTTTIVVGN